MAFQELNNLQTDFYLINTENSSGGIVLPSAARFVGQKLTFKDPVGFWGSNPLTLSTPTGSLFEDGTATKVLREPYGFLSLVSDGASKWYIEDGTHLASMTVSSLQIPLSLSNVFLSTPSATMNTLSFQDSILNTNNPVYTQSSLLYYGDEIVGGTQVGPTQFIPFTQPFTPRSAAGLGLWLDAGDPTSIVFLGANVFRWIDKSENRLTAGQFFAISSYSNNAVRFITNQGLQVAYSASENIQSGFIVCGFNNAADSNTILGSANFEGGRLFRVSRGILQTVSQSVSTILDTGYQLSSLTTYITEYVNTGSTLTHYVNGNTYASGASATYFPGLFTCIGLRNGPFEPLNGYIHEIVMYSSALSTSNRQQVEGYLAWKWGLVANLPSDHPYKSFPP